MRRRRVLWSPDARQDLARIYAYIRRDNPLAARRFANQLQGKVERLAEIGVSGTRRLDLGDDISAIVFRDRIILLKLFDERMHILRVLHGRQNIHDLFSSDD